MGYMNLGSRPAWAATAILGMALIAVSCASKPKDGAKPDGVSSVSLVSEATPISAGELGLMPGTGKVLVVYFTTGNAAQRVAKDLAGLYSADLELILEKKPKAWNFMTGGFAATMGLATPIKPPAHDPAAYDRVFVLTPVWAWSLAPQVRSWLGWAKGRLPQLAFGTISGDTEPDKIVARMARLGGRTPYAYAGFSQKDFLPENRGVYVEKLAYLTGAKPKAAE